MAERDENEIGALWLKEGQKGKYMTGTVNGERVVVFKNTRKQDGSKAPDYRVLRAQKRAERPSRDEDDVAF